MTALRNAIINSSCLLYQDTLNYSNILRNEALNKTHYRWASVFVFCRLFRVVAIFFQHRKQINDNLNYFTFSLFHSFLHSALEHWSYLRGHDLDYLHTVKYRNIAHATYSIPCLLDKMMCIISSGISIFLTMTL